MPLGNPITQNIDTRIVSATATGGQTSFSISGGYTINNISVYRNGVRLSNADDFTAGDGSTVSLNVAADPGDRLDFHIFDKFSVANAIVGAASTQTISGNLALTGELYVDDFIPAQLNVTGVSTLTGNAYVGSAITMYASAGIVSATSFYGDGSNLSGIDATTVKDSNSVTRLSGTTSGISINGTTTGLSVSGIATASGGIDASDAQYNTRVGTNAGDSFDGTNAASNTLIGYNSGTAITTGDNNTVVGSGGLIANTTGSDNTVVGMNAADANTTGIQNTVVGSSALSANTTANNNTAIGYKALLVNTTGEQNTAVGGHCLDANTTANYNTAVGYNCLTANSTGADNAALGRSALEANTTASNNTAIGNYA